MILQNDYGVDLSGVQWVTFEDGHVAEAGDPPGVIRARADRDITTMLIAGELDAAIYGAALPKDPRLQSVIPDPDGAARSWYSKHALVPVNHMVVVTDDSPGPIRRPSQSSTVCWRPGKLRRRRGLSAPRPSVKRDNRRCLDLLLSYCAAAKLISPRLKFEDLW